MENGRDFRCILCECGGCLAFYVEYGEVHHTHYYLVETYIYIHNDITKRINVNVTGRRDGVIFI